MQNHPMQKANRQLSDAETMEILKKGHHATLSLNGDDGYPYAVPVNYVVVDDKIYIHSAQYGYKMECIQRDPKCCFSAIVSAEILPAKMTAKFESVVVTGQVACIADEQEKVKALNGFVTILGAGHEEVGYKMIEKMIAKTAILRIDAEEITGKAYRG